jgi:glycerol-3-phosphate dehydrogenase (NAD(P)+)
MANVTVIGAGAWGTALACQAAKLGHSVGIWALEPEVAASITDERRNHVYLPGIELPPMRAGTDPESLLAGADHVVLVVPSQHLRSVSARIAPALPPGALVVVATKGIEERSAMLMSQVLAETLPAVPAERLVFLSGPSFAREMASGKPTDVVAASAGATAARTVQALLHSRMFRIYAGADPIGVQVGGALKNVIAVAAGVCDGLDLGTNARAGLITRGLMEITRLGVALGANPLTFLGLSGVGDLILTCTGELSRNRTLGVKLAQGVDAQSFLAGQRSVAEGFSTAAAACELARKLGIEMPISEQVYHVLHRGRSPTDAFHQLVGREFKDELRGLG